jgi:hypothetical protein
MNRKTWTGIICSLALLLLCSYSAAAFDKVKFAVISDPHISLPEQKGIKDGYKLGLKTVMLTENTVAELNKIPDIAWLLGRKRRKTTITAGGASSSTMPLR